MMVADLIAYLQTLEPTLPVYIKCEDGTGLSRVERSGFSVLRYQEVYLLVLWSSLPEDEARDLVGRDILIYEE